MNEHILNNNDQMRDLMKILIESNIKIETQTQLQEAASAPPTKII